jgi:hypothetical protein
MKFFTYSNASGTLEINDEGILLTKEFKALLDPKRNITKEDKTGSKKLLAFKELKYIYLFFDWESPYFQMAEQERNEEAFKDSELTEQEFEDETFKQACRKYYDIQESNLSLQLLKSAQEAVRSVSYQLKNVDLNERDPVSGKPIFKNKDVIAEIKGCKDLLISLRELENQVKKELDPGAGLRGDTEAGMFD